MKQYKGGSDCFLRDFIMVAKYYGCTIFEKPEDLSDYYTGNFNFNEKDKAASAAELKYRVIRNMKDFLEQDSLAMVTESLAKKEPVIIELLQSDGTGSHFVTATGYENGGLNRADINVADPAKGEIISLDKAAHGNNTILSLRYFTK